MKGEAVYILGGLRTPITHRGGALAHVRPEELGSTVIRALLARYGLPANALPACWRAMLWGRAAIWRG